MDLKIEDWINNLDSDVSNFEKLCFHKWLRWEVGLYNMGTISEENMRIILGFGQHEEYKLDESVSALMDYIAGDEVLETTEDIKRSIDTYEIYSYYNAIENKNNTLETVQNELKKITKIKMKLSNRYFEMITDANILRIKDLYFIAFEKGQFNEFIKAKFPNYSVKLKLWKSNSYKMMKKLRCLTINAYLSNWKDKTDIKNVIKRMCCIWTVNLNRAQLLLKRLTKIKDIINYKQSKQFDENEFDHTNQIMDDIDYLYELPPIKNLSQIDTRQIKTLDIERARKSKLFKLNFLIEDEEDEEDKLIEDLSEFKIELKEAVSNWFKYKFK